jgi:hypothetical protein
MTAQPTYLSPRELSITPDEHRYLVRAAEILAPMSAGERITIPGDGEYEFDMGLIEKDLYVSHDSYEKCGTAGCILGLCRVLAAVDKSTAFDIDSAPVLGMFYSDALVPLFYPNTLYSYARITPAHAARATRHFLETGEIDFGDPEGTEPAA